MSLLSRAKAKRAVVDETAEDRHAPVIRAAQEEVDLQQEQRRQVIKDDHLLESRVAAIDARKQQRQAAARVGSLVPDNGGETSDLEVIERESTAERAALVRRRDDASKAVEIARWKLHDVVAAALRDDAPAIRADAESEAEDLNNLAQACLPAFTTYLQRRAAKIARRRRFDERLGLLPIVDSRQIEYQMLRALRDYIAPSSTSGPNPPESVLGWLLARVALWSWLPGSPIRDLLKAGGVTPPSHGSFSAHVPIGPGEVPFITQGTPPALSSPGGGL